MASESRQDDDSRSQMGGEACPEGQVFAGQDAERAAPVTAAWLREGCTVYQLTQDGWRRGEPQMTNLWTAHVQGSRLSRAGDAERVAQLMATAPAMLEALREAVCVLELADAYGLYEPGSLGDADVKDCRDQLRAAHRAATGFYFTPAELALGADEALAPLAALHERIGDAA